MTTQATQTANWPPTTPPTADALLDCIAEGECFRDRLLNAGEVAEILGLGRSKVYEMMARGELPTVRIGAAVRVPRGALATYIQQRTTGPQRPA